MQGCARTRVFASALFAVLALSASCSLLIGDLPDPIGGSVNEPMAGVSGDAGGDARGEGGAALGVGAGATSGGAQGGASGSSNLGASAGSGSSMASGGNQGGSARGGVDGEGAEGGSSGETATGGVSSGVGGAGVSAGMTSSGGSGVGGGSVGGTANGGSGGTGGGSGGNGGGSGGSGGSPSDCDLDRDGWLATSSACGGDDCDDTDDDAHPGQTGFFTSQRKSGGYDFNCDGDSERQFAATLDCSNLLDTACGGEGFADPLPACGASGSWISCQLAAAPLPVLCMSDSEGDRKMGCR